MSTATKEVKPKKFIMEAAILQAIVQYTGIAAAPKDSPGPAAKGGALKIQSIRSCKITTPCPNVSVQAYNNQGTHETKNISRRLQQLWRDAWVRYFDNMLPLVALHEAAVERINDEDENHGNASSQPST